MTASISRLPLDQLERFGSADAPWASSHAGRQRAHGIRGEQRRKFRELSGSLHEPTHYWLRKRPQRRSYPRPLSGEVSFCPIRHAWPTGCSVRAFAQVPREWAFQSSESFA